MHDIQTAFDGVEVRGISHTAHEQNRKLWVRYGYLQENNSGVVCVAQQVNERYEDDEFLDGLSEDEFAEYKIRGKNGSYS